MNSYGRGKWAEYYALFYLLLHGYWPQKIRYKTRVGEIDLIVKRGKTIVFMEVKYRETYDDGAYAISDKSKARIRRAAEQYMLEKEFESSNMGFDLRFDAVIVTKNYRINHIHNAF
jgi:putative endonuclease